MGTPHNTAEKGQIAKTVLMPGDPLRAKYIAETYLEDVECFNTVRNMFGYTGTYKGKRVSVMGSGMGIPSIAIYSYELFTMYDVDTIIRIGSAGAMQDEIKLRDLVVGIGASTDSNFAKQYKLPGTFAPIGDFNLARKVVELAEEKQVPVHAGNILSSDVFYTDDPSDNDRWKRMGILAVEMETAALYMNAARLGKKALGMFTISDHLYRDEALSPEDRQKSFHEMMEIALEIA
ncbi:MAG: purine-nucleoside phosphorylase [Dorea sp.]|nr:purine-nucleoside phosphorylase [Dorea sp.]